MKKIFLYSLAISIMSLGFTSCNDDEDQGTDTRVTYFANLELAGDDFMVLNVGDTYEEPGYVATEGADDITDKVSVSGTVNTSVCGFYDIVYSVANADNFAIDAVRTVMVKDPNNFASAYLAETKNYSGAPIVISDNGDGTYTISDVMGGFYFYYYYPGYEPTYDFHLEAIVKLKEDNTLEQVGAGSWYFSSKPTIKSGSYDPAKGTVTWTTSNNLSVTLTK